MSRTYSKVALVFVCIAGLILSITPVASCIDFPQRPIKIIVPADPGSGEDSDARAIAPYLQQYLGVNVMVENQPGAGGKIALERFQKTAPDGYTIISNQLPKSIIYEYMFKADFKTKDFSPIFAWSVSHNLLGVNAAAWKTFDEFAKAAKERTLSGALSAMGGVSHLISLALAKELGINVNWVPFDGTAQSLATLAGGHVDFSIASSSSFRPLISAGKLRPLAIFSDEHDPFFPEVPTSKELGMATIPFVLVVRGLQAPPNTPPAVVKVLEEACSKGVKEPAYVDWANKKQIILKSMSSTEYGDYIVKEGYSTVEKYGPLMKESMPPQ
jgi:tripartite-type tricarboxylate transporter receptor subunit TctC